AQLQSQGCCQSSVQLFPPAIVQFHVQLQIPLVPLPLVAVAAPVVGAAAGWLLQSQFQKSVEVGATSVDVIPGSGVQEAFQTQFQVQSPPGTPCARPGRTTETFVFELPLTVTTPSVGLAPVAVALFACETGLSLPGLPTRTETLTFRPSVCVA